MIRSATWFNRFTILLLLCCTQIVFIEKIIAQELNKEVYVIRPYEPILSDANKISFLPEIIDLSTEPPEFKYAISPRRIPSPYELNQIRPARMVAVTLPKITKSWIKLGIGNYATPLAEFNISNLRSRDYSFGAYFSHRSSHSNIRLSNNDKVPGGYANNNIQFYGQRLYSRANLSGNLHFEHHGFNYYGYNTALFADPLPDMKHDTIRQKTFLAGFKAGLASSHTDSVYLNYDVQVGFDYFTDRQNNIEGILSVNAGFSKVFNGLQLGVDFDIDYFDLKSRIDTMANTIVGVHPWISKRSMDWKFVLGVQAVADMKDITNFFFYPIASLDIIIVENVLVPFLGLSGKLKSNNYQQLTEENAFIKPGLTLENTSSNIIAYGGIKGNISAAVRFRTDVSYAVNKKMHFFVNDTLIPLQNQFTAEYDDVDLITYHGQLIVQPSTAFELSVEGNYYKYSMTELKKPWHKPEYDISVNMLYQIKNKIILNGEMTILGNRWVKNSSWPDEMQKLRSIADFNLQIDYHFSKPLTLFFNLYNISNRSYQIWNQFPSQRFNFLAGFSYKL